LRHGRLDRKPLAFAFEVREEQIDRERRYKSRANAS
jgi:hypothetical protein